MRRLFEYFDLHMVQGPNEFSPYALTQCAKIFDMPPEVLFRNHWKRDICQVSGREQKL